MGRVRRPSPAMAVALVALFVALGGSGYAASQLRSTEISYVKRSIPGKALKKNTVTGKQVRESKLAQVPSAKRADSAGAADRAGLLGGLGPGAFQRRITSAWVDADGDILVRQGSLSVSKNGTGQYHVNFGRSVVRDVVIATPSYTGHSASALPCGGAPGTICDPAYNNSRTVVVNVTSGSGTSIDGAFQIALLE